ncbi:MAG: FAD-dependent oxidoreductase [Sandarakinorhabdus sp.]
MRGLGQFDVIIAGGGLAGAVLADQLSARGWSVAVVERGGRPPPIRRPAPASRPG